MGGRRSEITNLPSIILQDPEKAISLIQIEQRAKTILENILSKEEKALITDN